MKSFFSSRTNKMALLLLVAPLFVMVFFQNCSESVDFQAEQGSFIGAGENSTNQPDGTNSPSDTTIPNEPPKDSETIIESFNSSREATPPLDIVWVIDNSGSMREEAAHVRNNFLNFINYVSQDSNLRLALISGLGNSGTRVSLPAGLNPNNYLQINKVVGSYDSLSLTQTYLNSTLKQFLRVESKKAFIFVTDDESLNFNESKLIQTFQSHFPGQQFISHSFVSLDRAQSPCGAREGQAYKRLSDQTGGQIFNICDQDWSSHFDTLAKAVIAQVNSTFTLKFNISVDDILNVKVNGNPISTNLYRIDGLNLTIDPSVFDEGNTFDIEVEYDRN